MANISIYCIGAPFSLPTVNGLTFTEIDTVNNIWRATGLDTLVTSMITPSGPFYDLPTVTRAAQFCAIAAALGVPVGTGSGKIMDLTPSVIQNPGDAGPWIKIPRGGSTAMLTAKAAATNPAGVPAVVADLTDNPADGNPMQASWAASGLTGPGTADGFQLVEAPGYVRLRLLGSHPANTPITGTLLFG